LYEGKFFLEVLFAYNELHHSNSFGELFTAYSFYLTKT
jgi:hypothetical protein